MASRAPAPPCRPIRASARPFLGRALASGTSSLGPSLGGRARNATRRAQTRRASVRTPNALQIGARRRWRPGAWSLRPMEGPSVSVELDRAGPLEVIEQNRLDVEQQLDLVADDDSAARELVLPGDAEVVAVDGGPCLETDAAQLALVLVSHPERGLPLSEGAANRSGRDGRLPGPQSAS